MRQPFAHNAEARQILADAESELQTWQPTSEELHTSGATLGANLMPTEDVSTTAAAPSHVGGVHGLTTAEVEAATAPADAVPTNKETHEGEHLQAAIAS